jgi:NAD dependent epimerase/dehydratase family enzyme
LKPYFQKGIGGPLGNGKQWFPWIHVSDCSHIYATTALQKQSENIQEVVYINAVAGEPITNKTFSKVFAKVLHRPHIFFIPKVALKLLYGDFANEMMYSQKVVSVHKYDFEYGNIESAMKDIVMQKK